MRGWDKESEYDPKYNDMVRDKAKERGLFNYNALIAHQAVPVEERLPGLSRMRPAQASAPPLLRHMQAPFAGTGNLLECLCLREAVARYKSGKPVTALEWFPDGKRLIAGTKDGEICILNTDSLAFSDSKGMLTSQVTALRWDYNGEFLLLGSGQGQIRLVNEMFAPQNKKPCLFNRGSAVYDLSWSPSSTHFVAAGQDAYPVIYKIGEELAEDRSLNEKGYDSLTCAWHPHKALIATGTKRTPQIQLWDPRDARCITQKHIHQDSITRVKWSPKGDHLISAGRDQALRVVDLRTLKEMSTMVHSHTRGDIRDFDMHPRHEGFLASCDSAGVVYYWDFLQGPAGGQRQKPLAGIQHAHEIPPNYDEKTSRCRTLKWHPLGHVLATGGEDGLTKIWCRELAEDAADPLSPNPVTKSLYGTEAFPSAVGVQLEAFRQAHPPGAHNRETEWVLRSVAAGRGLPRESRKAPESLSRDVCSGLPVVPTFQGLYRRAVREVRGQEGGDPLLGPVEGMGVGGGGGLDELGVVEGEKAGMDKSVRLFSLLGSWGRGEGEPEEGVEAALHGGGSKGGISDTVGQGVGLRDGEGGSSSRDFAKLPLLRTGIFAPIDRLRKGGAIPRALTSKVGRVLFGLEEEKEEVEEDQAEGEGQTADGVAGGAGEEEARGEKRKRSSEEGEGGPPSEVPPVQTEDAAGYQEVGGERGGTLLDSDDFGL
uniref:Translation initiation factor beta propellor-like domain-containing protein n=1 Tax=Chromera velia CCMP2878 TaxID=1169474 RepID=A0A0G4IFK9_9ALVE|eukprot:Cvel_13947.t1-p1 / transcript=Cvel_13947.t1 / gene=Cvel_13947 / organism=Chromera_velia_CCMP2878 / gene_product=Polyadenylation factor subunit 2, putative / transcript_product=Polyadenylation factor subunit 2, putative / location=Cvel_scaffold974:418-10246(+) / protein_length=709 / sequence_SO=supercontig / SO=protein_coding / is_pseudo=false